METEKQQQTGGAEGSPADVVQFGDRLTGGDELVYCNVNSTASAVDHHVPCTCTPESPQPVITSSHNKKVK